MWLVGGSTRLAYTCIYKDDANAVFWLAIIYLAFHPIGDFQRCFLCQVKMTGHWPIGSGSGGGGHTTNLAGGHSSPHFGTENNASDITCGIGDIRAHILCPQTTQELPKKQPWNRTTTTWRIVTNRLRTHKTLWRLQRGLRVPTNNAKGI